MLIMRKSLISGIVRTLDIPVTPVDTAQVRVRDARAECVPPSQSADDREFYLLALSRRNGR